VNTDQGSQFTAHEFVQAVKEQGCKLSMDRKTPDEAYAVMLPTVKLAA